MFKILIVLLVLLAILSGIAYAWCMTDWTCVSDCTQQGYQWGLCKKICTWCD